VPISGGAWWQDSAWLRLSGAPPAVRSARERIGGEAIDAASAQAWWDALRHCQLPLFASRVIWRLSVPGAAPPLTLPGEPLIDWGGALRWYADPRMMPMCAPWPPRQAARRCAGGVPHPLDAFTRCQRRSSGSTAG